jgi:hypothetical protein
MSDPRNDNAERDEQTLHKKDNAPSDPKDKFANYYYDDSTGYEIYPADEDGDEESAAESEAEA